MTENSQDNEKETASNVKEWYRIQNSKYKHYKQMHAVNGCTNIEQGVENSIDISNVTKNHN